MTSGTIQRGIGRQRESRNVVGLVVNFVSFPLFAVLASLAGAILPAMIVSDQHLPHPINLRIVWSPLVNSGLAGHA